MNVDEPRLRASAHSRGSRRFARTTERGASAVEYGLLLAGIAALIITAIFVFGGGSQGIFQQSCSTIVEDTGMGNCDDAP